MQTVTQRPTRCRKPAQRHIPRPELPEVGDASFYLAWYLRSLGECEALSACRSKEYRRYAKENRTLTHALTGAIYDLEKDLQLTAQRLLDKGLILFAHDSTTYFDQQVAA